MRALLLHLTLAFIITGCGDLGNTSDVSGAVMGSDFFSTAGSAESDGAGYTITLSDSSAFSCFPIGSQDAYLTVVIGSVDGPTSIPAAGNVFFNNFQDNINTTEAATSGTVSIDSVDTDLGTISGTIDASGDTSSVQGSFSVEICT